MSQEMGDSDWPRQSHVTSVARVEVRFASKKADGDAHWANNTVTIVPTGRYYIRMRVIWGRDPHCWGKPIYTDSQYNIKVKIPSFEEYYTWVWGSTPSPTGSMNLDKTLTLQSLSFPIYNGFNIIVLVWGQNMGMFIHSFLLFLAPCKLQKLNLE